MALDFVAIALDLASSDHSSQHSTCLLLVFNSSFSMLTLNYPSFDLYSDTDFHLMIRMILGYWLIIYQIHLFISQIICGNRDVLFPKHKHIRNEVIILSYPWPLWLPDPIFHITPKGNPGSLCLIPRRDLNSMFQCQPLFCYSRNSHFLCIDFEGDGIDNLSREFAASRCFILLQLWESFGL